MTRDEFRKRIRPYLDWCLGQRGATDDCPRFRAAHRYVDGNLCYGQTGHAANHLDVAGYYFWCATKGHVMAGRSPIDGHEYRRGWPIDERLSRAAHLALAKEHLAIARELRLQGRAVGY